MKEVIELDDDAIAFALSIRGSAEYHEAMSWLVVYVLKHTTRSHIDNAILKWALTYVRNNGNG